MPGSTGIDAYLTCPVCWDETDDVEYPYRARVDGNVWQLRLNDFPEEDLYTLIVNGVPVLDLNDWPGAWWRPT